MKQNWSAVTEAAREMGWWTLAHRAMADRAFFRDYSEWSAYRLVKPTRALLDAFERSRARSERKDYGARITLNYREAIETFGALCHGIKNRGVGPVIRAILKCRLQESRAALRALKSRPQASFAALLGLGDVAPADLGPPPRFDGTLAEFLEQRQTGLQRVAVLAAQNSLYQYYSPGAGRFLLLSAGRTVAEIKTGVASDMREESNSGFFLLDMSIGDGVAEPDLLAVAAMTVPKMLRGMVREIEFIADEGSLIAEFVAGLTESESFYGSNAKPGRSAG